jgi:hypothetical protein
MTYTIGFDGVVSAELKKLLQSVENRVNGLGMHVQASDMGASTVASGTPPPPDTDKPCPDGVKIGHYCVSPGAAVAFVIVVAGVAGGVAGLVTARLVSGRRQ